MLVSNFTEAKKERFVDYVPTGFEVLDKALGGGLPNELITLGATPSAGKTTLANQIADNIAKSGRNVLFVENFWQTVSDVWKSEKYAAVCLCC